MRFFALLLSLTTLAVAKPMGASVDQTSATAATQALVLTLDSGVAVRGKVAPAILPCLRSAWLSARKGGSHATVSLFSPNGSNVRVDLQHVKAMNVKAGKPGSACPKNLLIVSSGS